MNIGDAIKQADYNLFYFINRKLASTSLNEIMLLLRQAYTWIPIYLFLLVFFYVNCKKYFFPIVVLSILTFSLTDYISAGIIKPSIGRMRPCYNSELTFAVNNLPGCGGKYSMPSSHASNHFGLSTFWFLVIQHTLKSKWYWLWLWALAIGFAQVYVGVHFPGDILAGLVLGAATGMFTFYLFKRWIAMRENAELV